MSSRDSSRDLSRDLRCPAPYVYDADRGTCVEPAPTGFVYRNGVFVRNCPVGMTLNERNVCVRPVVSRTSFVNDTLLGNTSVIFGAQKADGGGIIVGRYNKDSKDLQYSNIINTKGYVQQALAVPFSSSNVLLAEFIKQEPYVRLGAGLGAAVEQPEPIQVYNATKNSLSFVKFVDTGVVPIGDVRKLAYLPEQRRLLALGDPENAIFNAKFDAVAADEDGVFEMSFDDPAYDSYSNATDEAYYAGSRVSLFKDGSTLYTKGTGDLRNGLFSETSYDTWAASQSKSLSDSTSRGSLATGLYGFVSAGAASSDGTGHAYASTYNSSNVLQVSKSIGLGFTSSGSPRVARFDLDDGVGANTVYAFFNDGLGTTQGPAVSFVSEKANGVSTASLDAGGSSVTAKATDIKAFGITGFYTEPATECMSFGTMGSMPDATSTQYTRYTTTFDCTGSDQTFAIRDNTIDLQVSVWGAGGASTPDDTGSGGAGAFVSGHLDRSLWASASSLTVVVGAGGKPGAVGKSYGGGGAGNKYRQGQGGGRSALVLNGTDLVTAGGGGGSVWTSDGGSAAGDATTTSGNGGPGRSGGRGASASLAGAGGIIQAAAYEQQVYAGTRYQGADASDVGVGGGGGGSGLNGGGAGAFWGLSDDPADVPGGGGAGSSYIAGLKGAYTENGGLAGVAPATDAVGYSGSIGSGGTAASGGIAGNGRIIITGTCIVDNGVFASAVTNASSSGNRLRYIDSPSQYGSGTGATGFWAGNWDSLFKTAQFMYNGAATTAVPLPIAATYIDKQYLFAVLDASAGWTSGSTTFVYAAWRRNPGLDFPTLQPVPASVLTTTSMPALTGVTSIRCVRSSASDNSIFAIMGAGVRIAHVRPPTGDSSAPVWVVQQAIDAATKASLDGLGDFADGQRGIAKNSFQMVSSPKQLTVEPQLRSKYSVAFASSYNGTDVASNAIVVSGSPLPASIVKVSTGGNDYFALWPLPEGSWLVPSGIDAFAAALGTSLTSLLSGSSWVSASSGTQGSLPDATTCAVTVRMDETYTFAFASAGAASYTVTLVRTDSSVPNAVRSVLFASGVPDLLGAAKLLGINGNKTTTAGSAGRASLNTDTASVLQPQANANGSKPVSIATQLLNNDAFLGSFFHGYAPLVKSAVGPVGRVVTIGGPLRSPEGPDGNGAVPGSNWHIDFAPSDSDKRYYWRLSKRSSDVSRDVVITIGNSTTETRVKRLLGPFKLSEALSVASGAGSTESAQANALVTKLKSIIGAPEAVFLAVLADQIQDPWARLSGYTGTLPDAAASSASVVTALQGLPSTPVVYDSSTDSLTVNQGSSLLRSSVVLVKNCSFAFLPAKASDASIDWTASGSDTLALKLTSDGSTAFAEAVHEGFTVRSSANILYSNNNGASFQTALSAAASTANANMISRYAGCFLDMFHFSDRYAIEPASFNGLLNAAVSQFNDIKWIPDPSATSSATSSSNSSAGFFMAVGNFVWPVDALFTATWPTSIAALRGCMWLSQDGITWKTASLALPLTGNGTKVLPESFWLCYKVSVVSAGPSQKLVLFTDLGMYAFDYAGMAAAWAAPAATATLTVTPIATEAPFGATCIERTATGSCFSCADGGQQALVTVSNSKTTVVSTDVCLEADKAVDTVLGYSPADRDKDEAGITANAKQAFLKLTANAESLAVCPKAVNRGLTPSPNQPGGGTGADASDVMHCSLDSCMSLDGETFSVQVDGKGSLRRLCYKPYSAAETYGECPVTYGVGGSASGAPVTLGDATKFPAAPGKALVDAAIAQRVTNNGGVQRSDGSYAPGPIRQNASLQPDAHLVEPNWPPTGAATNDQLYRLATFEFPFDAGSTDKLTIGRDVQVFLPGASAFNGSAGPDVSKPNKVSNAVWPANPMPREGHGYIARPAAGGKQRLARLGYGNLVLTGDKGAFEYVPDKPNDYFAVLKGRLSSNASRLSPEIYAEMAASVLSVPLRNEPDKGILRGNDAVNNWRVLVANNFFRPRNWAFSLPLDTAATSLDGIKQQLLYSDQPSADGLREFLKPDPLLHKVQTFGKVPPFARAILGTVPLRTHTSDGRALLKYDGQRPNAKVGYFASLGAAPANDHNAWHYWTYDKGSATLDICINVSKLLNEPSIDFTQVSSSGWLAYVKSVSTSTSVADAIAAFDPMTDFVWTDPEKQTTRCLRELEQEGVVVQQQAEQLDAADYNASSSRLRFLNMVFPVDETWRRDIVTCGSEGLVRDVSRPLASAVLRWQFTLQLPSSPSFPVYKALQYSVPQAKLSATDSYLTDQAVNVSQSDFLVEENRGYYGKGLEQSEPQDLMPRSDAEGYGIRLELLGPAVGYKASDAVGEVAFVRTWIDSMNRWPLADSTPHYHQLAYASAYAPIADKANGIVTSMPAMSSVSLPNHFMLNPFKPQNSCVATGVPAYKWTVMSPNAARAYYAVPASSLQVYYSEYLGVIQGSMALFKASGAGSWTSASAFSLPPYVGAADSAVYAAQKTAAEAWSNAYSSMPSWPASSPRSYSIMLGQRLYDLKSLVGTGCWVGPSSADIVGPMQTAYSAQIADWSTVDRALVTSTQLAGVLQAALIVVLGTAMRVTYSADADCFAVFDNNVNYKVLSFGSNTLVNPLIWWLGMGSNANDYTRNDLKLPWNGADRVETVMMINQDKFAFAGSAANADAFCNTKFTAGSRENLHYLTGCRNVLSQIYYGAVISSPDSSTLPSAAALQLDVQQARRPVDPSLYASQSDTRVLAGLDISYVKDTSGKPCVFTRASSGLATQVRAIALPDMQAPVTGGADGRVGWSTALKGYNDPQQAAATSVKLTNMLEFQVSPGANKQQPYGSDLNPIVLSPRGITDGVLRFEPYNQAYTNGVSMAVIVVDQDCFVCVTPFDTVSGAKPQNKTPTKVTDAPVAPYIEQVYAMSVLSVSDLFVDAAAMPAGLTASQILDQLVAADTSSFDRFGSIQASAIQHGTTGVPVYQISEKTSDGQGLGRSVKILATPDAPKILCIGMAPKDSQAPAGSFAPSMHWTYSPFAQSKISVVVRSIDQKPVQVHYKSTDAADTMPASSGAVAKKLYKSFDGSANSALGRDVRRVFTKESVMPMRSALAGGTYPLVRAQGPTGSLDKTNVRYAGFVPLAGSIRLLNGKRPVFSGSVLAGPNGFAAQTVPNYDGIGYDLFATFCDYWRSEIRGDCKDAAIPATLPLLPDTEGCSVLETGPWKTWNPFVGGRAALGSAYGHDYSSDLWFATYLWQVGKSDPNNTQPTSMATTPALMTANGPNGQSYGVFTCTDGSIRKAQLKAPFQVTDTTDFDSFQTPDGASTHPGKLYNMTFFEDQWFCTGDNGGIWTTAAAVNSSDTVQNFVAGVIKFQIFDEQPDAWKVRRPKQYEAHPFAVFKVLSYGQRKVLFASDVDGRYVIIGSEKTTQQTVDARGRSVLVSKSRFRALTDYKKAFWFKPNGQASDKSSVFVSDVSLAGDALSLGILPIRRPDADTGKVYDDAGLLALAFGVDAIVGAGSILQPQGPNWNTASVAAGLDSPPLLSANVVTARASVAYSASSMIGSISDAVDLKAYMDKFAQSATDTLVSAAQAVTRKAWPYAAQDAAYDCLTAVSIDSSLLKLAYSIADVPDSSTAAGTTSLFVELSDVLLAQKIFLHGGISMPLLTAAFFSTKPAEGAALVLQAASPGTGSRPVAFASSRSSAPYFGTYHAADAAAKWANSFAYEIKNVHRLAAQSSQVELELLKLSSTPSRSELYQRVFLNQLEARACPVAAMTIVSDMAAAPDLNAVAWASYGPYASRAVAIALPDANGKLDPLDAPSSSSEIRMLSAAIVGYSPYEMRFYAAGVGSGVVDLGDAVPSSMSTFLWASGSYKVTKASMKRFCILTNNCQKGVTSADNTRQPWSQLYYKVRTDTPTISAVSRAFENPDPSAPRRGAATCFGFASHMTAIGGFTEQASGQTTVLMFKPVAALGSDEADDVWAQADFAVAGSITTMYYTGYAWYIAVWDSVKQRSKVYFASTNFSVINSVDAFKGPSSSNSLAKISSIASIVAKTAKVNGGCGAGFSVDPNNPTLCIKDCPPAFRPVGNVCVLTCPPGFRETSVPSECVPEVRVARTAVPQIKGMPLAVPPRQLTTAATAARPTVTDYKSIMFVTLACLFVVMAGYGIRQLFSGPRRSG